jgi:fucose permease
LPAVALLLVIAVAGLATLGIGNSAIAVAWPSISDTFARPISDLGVLVAASVIGYGTASLLCGKLTRRFSSGRLLVTGTVGILIGLVAFVTVEHWQLLIAAALIQGAGAATIGNTFNVHMALTNNQRGMNLMHAGFGTGATLGPLLITVALRTVGSWRFGYAVLIVPHTIMLLTYSATMRHWASPSRLPEPTATPDPPVRWTALIVPAALFTLYTGFEQATGYWSYTLFTEAHGISETVAGFLVGGFWASLAAGRVLVGVFGTRLRPAIALGTGTMLALVGTWLLWWAPATWITGMGLVIIGTGLAPVFPAMMSLTPGRVGTQRTATAIGLQSGSASLGVLLLPAAMKFLVDAFGITVVGPTLFAGSAVLMLAVGAVYPWRSTSKIRAK